MRSSESILWPPVQKRCAAAPRCDRNYLDVEGWIQVIVEVEGHPHEGCDYGSRLEQVFDTVDLFTPHDHAGTLRPL
jgi:hypothetical protein